VVVLTKATATEVLYIQAPEKGGKWKREKLGETGAWSGGKAAFAQSNLHAIFAYLLSLFRFSFASQSGQRLSLKDNIAFCYPFKF